MSSEQQTKRAARRRSMERALEISEARFRRVVESAPNAMVMISSAGLIEMVNTQTELMFGYPRLELLGKPVEILVPERFRSHHPQLRRSFFGEPRARPMGAGRDLYALRKDGSEFPVEIGLNPIEMEDGPMVLSAIVDISDRKHKEEHIRAALKEKELLLGEVHHRVKNNLQIIQSLLYLQAAKIDDPTVTAILMESQNRIKSMALIHQTLYQSKDFERVDFSHFLDSLAPNLVSSYSVDPGRVSLSIDADDVHLPIHAAIPCGLIVNELISNALKHAFPAGRSGRIEIGLARGADGAVAMAVEDDGVGLPEGLDILKTETLGLQMVSLLSQQIGAEMTVNPSDPTRFKFQFPVSP
jgi:PAS domain S-box-containing protein